MINIKEVHLIRDIVFDGKYRSRLPVDYGAFLCNEDGIVTVKVINTIGEVIKVLPIHVVESFKYAARTTSDEPIFSRKKGRRSSKDNTEN